MPINRTYPLAELLAALRRYPLEPRRRITFEYILLDGFNDRPRTPTRSARRLRGVPVKVNLIPINPDPVLARLDASVRTRRGSRRSGTGSSSAARPPPCAASAATTSRAACGQLRAFARPARGSRARGARRPEAGPGPTPPAGHPGSGRRL